MSSVNDTIRYETANLDQLSRGTRAYFQARTRNRLYNLAMSKFREKKETEGLTQAQVARRMGRRPEVVNRLFASPSNWESDTLSDLLLAIAGEEIDATSKSPFEKPATNRRTMDRDRESPFKPVAKSDVERRREVTVEKKELDQAFSFV